MLQFILVDLKNGEITHQYLIVISFVVGTKVCKVVFD